MEANSLINNKLNFTVRSFVSQIYHSLVEPRERDKLLINENSNNSFFKPYALTHVDINILGSLFILCACVVLFKLSCIQADAAPMSGVSDIFNSRTFIGDTKWLEKMNWVGRAVNMFISIGGTIAAVIIAVQLMLTLIYWGNPNLWDSVNQVKVVDQKKGLLNYTASLFSGGKSAMVGNLSRGSDIIMDYLILIAPNIKKYSENAEDEFENFTTWLMGTFMKKCLLLLAISMMINGSLLQAYMVVVDGMGVAAQRFVEIDSKTLVNNMLSVGDNYQFSVGASGTGVDKLQGDVAGAIYKEVMKSSKISTSDYKYTIGSNIERYVRSNITKDNIQSYLIGPGAKDGKLTDEDFERVRIEVVLNGTSGTTNGLTISSSDLQLEDVGKPRYIHLYFTLKSKGDTTNYFGLPGSDD